jgi:hypothetical protein
MKLSGHKQYQCADPPRRRRIRDWYTLALKNIECRTEEGLMIGTDYNQSWSADADCAFSRFRNSGNAKVQVPARTADEEQSGDRERISAAVPRMIARKNFSAHGVQ